MLMKILKFVIKEKKQFLREDPQLLDHSLYILLLKKSNFISFSIHDEILISSNNVFAIHFPCCGF